MSTYNITYRRYRHRKDSVLTANRSATLTKSWNDHFLHIQIIHTDCNGKNVHNGIHRSYFVKMHHIFRYIMGFRLRMGQNGKDFFRIGSRTVCHICMVNDLHDLIKATVFVVMVTVVGMHRFCMYMMFMRMGVLMSFQGFMTMLMMMLLMSMTVRMSMEIFHIMVVILMFLIQQYIKITGIDPGFYHTADLYVEAFYRKAFKSSLQFFLICAKIQKCRNCHISADPGGTLQI